MWCEAIVNITEHSLKAASLITWWTLGFPYKAEVRDYLFLLFYFEHIWLTPHNVTKQWSLK